MEDATISDRLKSLIPDRQKSEMARKCQIPIKTFASYLEGVEPSASKLVQLARGLDVNVLWLATGEGPKRADGNVKPAPAPSGEVTNSVEQMLENIDRFLRNEIQAPLPENEIQQYLVEAATNSDLSDELRGQADLFLRLVYKDKGAEARQEERSRVFRMQREAARMKIQDIAKKEKIELPPIVLPHLDMVVDRYDMADTDIELLIIGFHIAILEAQGKLKLPEPDAD